jgi:hypothetical protein
MANLSDALIVHDKIVLRDGPSDNLMAAQNNLPSTPMQET